MNDALPLAPMLLAERLARALTALLMAVSARARASGGSLGVTARRLGGLCLAFALLVDQAKTGRLRASPRRTNPNARDSAAGARRPGTVREGAVRTRPVRGAFGWALDLAGHETIPRAEEIRVLLSQPGMAALVAQAPARFRRIVGPLCWSLGLTPPQGLFAPRPKPDPARDVRSPPLKPPTPEAPSAVRPAPSHAELLAVLRDAVRDMQAAEPRGIEAGPPRPVPRVSARERAVPIRRGQAA